MRNNANFASWMLNSLGSS